MWVPPITAMAPAARTWSASRYDCGAVEVMAEIATRSAESTSFMSTGWMSSMYTRTSYPLARMIVARRTEPSRGMQTRL